MNTNNSSVDNKKLSTGIAGLDALFYGGIHTHKSENGQKGILMLTRGQHGVNKIHLAMQICEGLNNSQQDKNDKKDALDKSFEDSLKFAYYIKNEPEIKEKILETINTRIRSLKSQQFVIDRVSILNDNKKIVDEGESVDNQKGIIDWISIRNDFPCFELIKSKINIVKIQSNERNDGIENGIKNIIKEVFSIQRESVDEGIQEWAKDKWNILKLLREKNRSSDSQLLFISINKNTDLLKNSYYDFYIQRLIRNIRINDGSSLAKKSVALLRTMLWYRDGDCKINGIDLLEKYELPSITGEKPSTSEEDYFMKHLKSGFIYYNGRTHGLHIRHQKGAKDTGGMLLCKLFIPDDYNNVRIVGKDTLNKGNNIADGLTSFQNMINYLDHYNENGVGFIMIDGLSRLTKEEIAQCPFNALSDRIRTLCKVGIITADEKLAPSDISVDIVIDMAIRESNRPDHLYNALKISKCLYQKNAYGWHRYKMRNAGIEVIPSIHLQMGQRFLMDDVVSDAILPINKYPYPFWLNENDTIYEDNKDNNEGVKDIKDARDSYDEIDDCGYLKNHKLESRGCLEGHLLEVSKIGEFIKKLILKSSECHHVLFVNFDRNRTFFCNDYIKMEECGEKMDFIHLFNFHSGYCHADEILWALDEQAKVLEKKAREKCTDNKLETHYTHVSVVIGDFNYIHYAYPCLSAEPLLLPALSAYTKKHHMTNYVYATKNEETDVESTDLHKKEIETIMQMRRITDYFEEPNGK